MILNHGQALNPRDATLASEATLVHPVPNRYATFNGTLWHPVRGDMAKNARCAADDVAARAEVVVPTDARNTKRATFLVS
jgi:hypothetical protein